MAKKKAAPVSAGLLLYRLRNGRLEVFLAHPGGPFWAKRDVGAWSIPKGLVESGEDLLDAACREFAEETGARPQGPFRPLGIVTQKGGKQVHAWACAGSADPERVESNEVRMEWPPGSGRWLTFPEIDRCEWFDLKTARQKINAAQAAFLDRLETEVSPGGTSPESTGA
ncbi:MAG TPA: NUDIX domain-containing protein [Gemmataceae bacterium]|nr:NUDIX domain-containing protein [Gemmataceae bacterium]